MADVKTSAFMLSSATLMMGRALVDDVFALTPDQHSVGMVSEIKISLDSSLNQLRNGVAQIVVDSKRTDLATSITGNVFEMTAKNFLRSQGIARATPTVRRGRLVTDVAAGAVVLSFVSNPVAGDGESVLTEAAQIPVGSSLLIQRPSGENEYIFPTRTSGAATLTNSIFSVPIAGNFAIPSGMSFPAGSRVWVVDPLPVGDIDMNDLFCVKIVGMLSNFERPVTYIAPKVMVSKGFSVAFTETQYGSMPWELMPLMLSRDEAASVPRLNEVGPRRTGLLLVGSNNIGSGESAIITPPSTPAPSFTTSPFISGTATVGQTLTGNDGAISNGAVSLRQWLRSGSAISGANSSTYLLTAADAGLQITYNVTAAGAGGTTGATSAPVTVAASAVAPTFSVNPAVTGTAAVGSTLTGSDGTIANGTVSARQWLRGGTAISGATNSTYQLVAADAGQSISFRVTATGSGGSASATSGTTSIPAAPAFSVNPSISGTPQVGQVLSGADGSFSGGTVAARQWLLNGNVISGATGATYAPVSGDSGGQVSYRVTISGSGGNTSATSGAVTIAAAVTPPPTFTVDPGVTGTAAVGQTLTGTDGTVSNGTIASRQWQRNGADISGATANTYQLVAADAGTTVTFKVTATGSGGTATKSSSGTSIPAAPAFTSAASISGTPQTGSTLTGSDGTITNGTVASRAWLLNGTAISGANGPSYIPVQSDEGKQVSYRVTASGAGGTATSTSAGVTITAAAAVDPVVTYTAWPYTDDFSDAAEGSDPLTRPNWTATGNSTDRYRIGTFNGVKSLYNNNIYRPNNQLQFGPDLNTDGTDFGYEIEVDENRAGNVGAQNGSAYSMSTQTPMLFYRGDTDKVAIGAGDTGILPRITNVTAGGTDKFSGATFRHRLQTPPPALGAGSPSVRTLYQYHNGRLRTRLLNSGDWAVNTDTSGYPKDSFDLTTQPGLTTVADRHGKFNYQNGTWTYPLLNRIRIRPLRMIIMDHARYCSRTTFTSGVGRIWIKGDFRGTPVSWAYRVISKPDNAIVQSWKNCTDVAANTGTGKFSVYCTIPQGGPYEIELAMTDSDGAVSNTWTKRVACGELYLTNGQSNSVNRGNAASGLTVFNPKAAAQPYLGFNTDKVPLTEMGGMGTDEWSFPCNVEMSRVIADATGVPCLTLTTGVSGSGIAGVFNDKGFADTITATLARVEGVVDGVIWDQGEGDRDGVYSPDDYYDQLKAGYLKMVNATGNPNLPMWISPIGNFPSTSTPNGLTNWPNVDKYARVVKLAYERLIAENPGKIMYADHKLGQIHNDNDPYHYKAPSYQMMSRRAAYTILKWRGFPVADALGPTPTGISRNGAVLTLSLNMNGAASLTDLLTNPVINTDQRGTPALSGALYGYEVSSDGFASLLPINSITRSGNTLVITLASDPGKAVQIRSFHGASYEDKYLFWGTYADGRDNIAIAPIINYLTSN